MKLYRFSFFFQLQYLRDYNKMVQDKIGPLLTNNQKAYDWLMKKTIDLNPRSTSVGAINVHSALLMSILAVCSLVVVKQS